MKIRFKLPKSKKFKSIINLVDYSDGMTAIGFIILSSILAGYIYHSMGGHFFLAAIIQLPISIMVMSYINNMHRGCL